MWCASSERVELVGRGAGGCRGAGGRVVASIGDLALDASQAIEYECEFEVVLDVPGHLEELVPHLSRGARVEGRRLELLIGDESRGVGNELLGVGERARGGVGERARGHVAGAGGGGRSCLNGMARKSGCGTRMARKSGCGTRMARKSGCGTRISVLRILSVQTEW